MADTPKKPQASKTNKTSSEEKKKTSKKTTAKSKTKSSSPKSTKKTAPKSTKKTETRQSPSTETPKESTPLTNTAETIEEKAKTVGEKSTEIVSDISETTTKFTSEISKKSTKAVNNLLEKLKGNLSDAYEASAKFAEQVQDQVQGYAEKYKNVAAMNRLKADKDRLLKKLGDSVYALYAEQNRKQVSFKKQELESLLKEIETIDVDILKIGEQLDKQSEK
ncbi:MAG: hypothetical protein GF313_15120 [Caldithrix sp.]|nr:hypothetical protein [Caldithrix sp.]